MLIFTNDDLGVSDKNYFSLNNKKIFLKSKDITLDEMREYHHSFLENGANKDDLLYFIDDRSTSLMTSEKLSEIENYLKLLLDNVDVFYLSNFMDNCKVMKPISSHIPEDLKNIRFYHSLAPNGFYATVSSFEKWEVIFNMLDDRKENKIASRLSSLVLEGKVKAGTSWPRIFVPDINKLSNDMDNFYTYPCRIEKNFVNSEKKEIEELSMFWFVFGVIIILFSFMILTKIVSIRKLWNGMESYR
jgi:hypothetical protein